MPEPRHRRGKSKQDVATPRIFIEAACHKLRIREFSVDLAAHHGNFVVEPYITPDMDSLSDDVRWEDFTRQCWGWLNPEFADIHPWVDKAWRASRLGAQVAVLVPASVGSLWWKECVHEKAYVLFLNGRIKFVGSEDYYPKDLALLLYHPMLQGGYSIWSWMQELKDDRRTGRRMARQTKRLLEPSLPV